MSLGIEVQRSAALDPRAEQVMVPMRDGVQLATDVYLPDGIDRAPAILVREPYDKAGRYTYLPHVAPYFTGRGYVFVTQDVRGKFRSEGETVAFVHEVDDGYDTIDWVVAQPWCDGTVGMWGDSYYGYTQWAAVASEHPALKAIVPRVTSADLGWYPVPRDAVIPLYAGEYLATCWLDHWLYSWQIDYGHRPLAEVFDAGFEAIGGRAEGFDRFVEESLGERPIGDSGVHPFDVLRIPVLHAGGWFDNLMPDQMHDFLTLIARPEVASLQYLEMDSSDHESYNLEFAPIAPEDDHDVNDDAMARMIPRYLGGALDFFDVFLQGKSHHIPRVRWHQGNDTWRTAPSWPPPGARELRLHLTAADRATIDADGGGLRDAPDATKTTARWVHDPANLVPSTVVNPFGFLLESPDESSVEARPDVLTFTTEVLDRRLDLAGPVAVRVGLGSSAPSAHLFAKLVDVRPDGSTLMLVRGQTLVRDPDASRPVQVDLAHIGYRVLPGHRLRLHLASSDFPLYLPHPGTDENPWRAVTGRPSHQTLHVGGASDAFVCLTLVD